MLAKGLVAVTANSWLTKEPDRVQDVGLGFRV